jgi:hypothetical protein
MSGFDQWLSGSLSSVAGASVLPVWAAGALAALLCFAGMLAFTRAAQRRSGLPWRVALLLIGAGLMWVMMDAWAGRDASVARRALDARTVDLTLRAIAPGSPLACLDIVGSETVETACEKSLFASSQAVAQAVAYVDARLSLLADGLELAARDRGYEASIERLRRSLEGDRFGIVAHVLASRGCTAENCAALKLFRDPSAVVANLRDRTFDSNVIVRAAAWNAAPAAPGEPAAAPVAAPALAAAPRVTTTGTAPPAGKYDFPSSASIPAISIMNAEPALPQGENNQPAASAAPAGPAAPAPAKPAPRRQTTRETPPAPPPQQQAPQAAVPMPLLPPGTIANPR